MAATGQTKSSGSAAFNEREWHDWLKGWADLMVDIWVDRLMALGVHDTGALVSSVKRRITIEATTEIEHSFLEYGIYQAAGVGYGYSHGNGGDLPFLGDDYRHAHGLDKPRKRGPKWGGGYTSGKPRKPRDWFTKKYFYSMHRLNERAARYYGESYQGYLSQALDEMFDPQSKLRSL